MKDQIARAVLAYGITIGFFACFILVSFVKLDSAQLTLVATMAGALVTNWKIPLNYFFEGSVSMQAKDATISKALDTKENKDVPKDK